MYKLIIADDEKIVLDGISESIHWSDYDIEVVAKASDGKELFEKAKQLLPDIVLTDIRMPQMDGLQAIEQLQQQIPDAQFVIITAYEEFEYAKRAIELEVAGFITKPVLKKQVIDHIIKAKQKLEQKKLTQQIISSHNVTDEQTKSYGTVIDRAIQFIKEHLETGPVLTELADYMHMNPSYFSRYFKEETGISFIEYVKDLKIERAKQLLSGSNMKTYEISSCLGYNSVQYFSTLFKKETQLTPQEYKCSCEKK